MVAAKNRRLHSGYILKSDLMGFPNGVDLGLMKKEESGRFQGFWPEQLKL